MNRDYEHTEFSRSVIAGLFGGITATCLSLVYNTFFRGLIGFHLSDMINVSTIIFSLVLIVTIAGVVFYFFHHYLKYGKVIFQALGIGLTILLAIGAMNVQRSPDAALTKEFRELLLGIISITAICVVFVIPFLYKRDFL